MPQNSEKFISPEKFKEPGKLTSEEVKEMVKKYKEENEGLLPKYFALPGEEKEEEREYSYSEETMLAYEIKKFLEKIRPELENKQLIKKVEEDLKLCIRSIQQQSGTTWDAMLAICGYAFLKQSGLWLKLDQESQDWIEKNIKDPQLIKNAEKDLKSKIESG